MSHVPATDLRFVETLAHSLGVVGSPPDRVRSVLEFVRTRFLDDALALGLSSVRLRHDHRLIEPGPIVVAAGNNADESRLRSVLESEAGSLLDADADKLLRGLRTAPSGAVRTRFSEAVAAWGGETLRREVLAPLGVRDAWACTLAPVGGSAVSVVHLESEGASAVRPDPGDLLESVARLLAPTLLSIDVADNAPRPAAGLTPAQRLVLGAALEGLSEKQIAHKLHRSHHTVHSHLQAIYRLYGVTTRAELLALIPDVPGEHD